MRSTILIAAALARIVAGAPAPAPEDLSFLDLGAILDAPAPDAVGPPQTAVASVTTTFFIDTASLAASISADVTAAATASITGAAASAASTQTPALKRRQATSTSSSDAPCPTTPEAGTYCGFINPEDSCAPQPAGYGPLVTPDTPEDFKSYPLFKQLSLGAQTPKGYSNVFKNLNASTTANSYITYKVLTSYNVSDCAAFCDSYSLCTAFNVFIERDPSINPSTGGDNADIGGWGSECPNPSSITNYKCSLWGSNIDAVSATNTGEARDSFQVVITGSNGYDKTNTTTPAKCPGWTPPTKCSGGAISKGGSYLVGSNFYPGPFDPSVCAIYAQAQTNKNKQVAISKGLKSYTPCNMFNSYMINKNGIPQGTYCALYNTVLTPSWASFLSALLGEILFSVKGSWTYSLTNQLTGKC